MKEVTHKLRQRFCKNFEIPINLFHEPYFSERLQLFNDQFKTVSLWDLYIKETGQFENDENYFAYYNQFKEYVIDHIKNKIEYAEFLNADMRKYSIPNYPFGRNSVFKETNIGKTLVSIDLTKANFSAMRYFNQALIDGKGTYEDFIAQFTEMEHLIKSKYVRQVIFGNLNPKRQTTIEHYMMNLLVEELLKHVDSSKIESFMCDEIVFKYDKNFDEILESLYNIAKQNDFDIHHEIYELRKIPNSDIYVKYLSNGKIDFKCVNVLFYPILLRRYSKQEIKDSDLVFFHEGYVSKFIEIPKIEVV